MRRVFLGIILAVLALVAALIGRGEATIAVAAPTGDALQLTTAFDEPLGGAPGTTAIACQDSWRPGTAGVTTETVSVPDGVRFLQVTLGAAQGDWDVAVFDSSGDAVVASAEIGTSESSTGWSARGGTLRLQVCRRTGDAAGVPVTLEHAAPVENVAAIKADPPQLVNVITPTRADKDMVQALGLDLTEHAAEKSIGVVLHGEDDRVKLRKAGLEWDVLVSDLVAQSVRQRSAEMTGAAQRAEPILPSGRTGTYRTLADYNTDMKKLADENPGLVKLIVLPNKTWMGKEVMGLEIAENVNAKDGRPAFFNMGVHHAREWPAGEMPMEWAFELVRGFKSGDPRTVEIVKKSRNIIVPIVNPDGFNASRTAGSLAGADGGRDESVDDTAYLVAGATTGGEYRRKNCRLPDDSMAGNCATSAGLAEPGVDPNRNYGGLWGGPGASTNQAMQTYRGPGPFSEPETRNVQSVVSTNQVMSLLTNHTTAALVLRAPGLASLGDPIDEDRGYKALGDAMAKETGYLSQNGFELYDTTGTTEDWSYNATGGFGFTIEIYCGEVDYKTGDCDDPAFHPRFNTGVEREWNGDNPIADHTLDPMGAFDGKGLREAYYIAAESTINEARHSIIEGSAPAGATLRLTKAFKTQTSPQPPDDKPIEFDDKLETTYEVGPSGTFKWHINPSTRPIVAKASGKEGAGDASPEETTFGGPEGSSELEDGPDDGASVPDTNNDAAASPSVSYNDHPFTVPATGDNASLSVNVSWPSPVSDWDIILFEDVDGNGKSDTAIDKTITVSAQGATNFEEVSIANEMVAPGKKYVLRVVNFAAVEPYDVTKTYEPFAPFVPAQIEKWTLTCEVAGQAPQSTEFVIERGEKKTPDLSACRAAGPAATPTPTVGPGITPGPGTNSCVKARGLKSVTVTPRGDGARFSFERRSGVTAPVQINVYKPATATKVIDTRKVKRFRGATGPVVWNGRDEKGRRLGDGYYFARFLVKTANGFDVQRVVLQRSGGKFSLRKPFDRRATCSTLRQYKLSRPVFGGSTNFPLRATFMLGQPTDVLVELVRDGKVVGRVRRSDQAANTRVTVRLKGSLRRGDYAVRLKAGGKTTTLFSRRI